MKILQSSYFPADNIYRTILNIDTIPLSMRYGGTGGSAAVNGLVAEDNISSRLRKQIDKLNVQIQLQRLSFQNVLDKALERELMLKCLPAIQPISISDVKYISSYFGSRTDPFNHEGQQIHAGIDFVAVYGVNVYATGNGIVTLCQNSRTGYGNEVVVDHAFGYSSRYAHLQEMLVEEGDEVKRGQIIGKVGSSGRSTGPHLHYEVRFENKAVDPALSLNPLNRKSMMKYSHWLIMVTKYTFSHNGKD
jgi:murein DD-endopeptidase MepM/ murein hydrolase activator NlpD